MTLSPLPGSSLIGPGTTVTSVTSTKVELSKSLQGPLPAAKR